MPKVNSLGHVGLFCKNLNVMRNFYENILGMTVTDYSDEREMVFLSSKPDIEHHEIFLTTGRDVEMHGKIVQQISFHVDSLKDVREFHEEFQANNTPIDSVVTHGNTASVYFRDPEGNRLEIYYSLTNESGKLVQWKQPFRKEIDITQDNEEILKQIYEMTFGSDEK